MKRLWFLGLLAIPALAQSVADDPARPALGKSGQIFVLKYVPKSSRLEVRLAGKEAALVEPGRLEIMGKVLRHGSEPMNLDIRPEKDHFQIKGDVAPDSKLEIQVKDKTTKKSETILIDGRP